MNVISTITRSRNDINATIKLIKSDVDVHWCARARECILVRSPLHGPLNRFCRCLNDKLPGRVVYLLPKHVRGPIRFEQRSCGVGIFSGEECFFVRKNFRVSRMVSFLFAILMLAPFHFCRWIHQNLV